MRLLILIFVIAIKIFIAELDYEPVSVCLTFAAHETEKFAGLVIKTDNEMESSETVELFLIPINGPVEVDLNQVSVVTILDRDGTNTCQ